MELENLGSLITYKDADGQDVCLGYLFDFTGHGIFSPDGKVEVSKEHADIHNQELDAALLKGLDERCKVGMHGTFYLRKNDCGRPEVITWLGTPVSNQVQIHGNSITFRRASKVYRGRSQKDADCFNFRRVA